MTAPGITEPCRACDGAGVVHANAGEDARGAHADYPTEGRVECPRCDGSGERPVAACQACGGGLPVAVIDGVAVCNRCLEPDLVEAARGRESP